MAGDAPARRRQKAQPNTRALAATPQTTRLPPLAAAEAPSYLPNHGLPGIEPEQPNAPKTTASAAGRAVPPRCRSHPATSAPPQDAYQLQLYGVTGAISPRFPISPALVHQHHAQHHRQTAHYLQNAESGHCMGGTACIALLIKVCTQCAAFTIIAETMHSRLGSY